MTDETNLAAVYKKQMIAALLGRMQLMSAVLLGRKNGFWFTNVSHAQVLLGRSRWVPTSVIARKQASMLEV